MEEGFWGLVSTVLDEMNALARDEFFCFHFVRQEIYKKKENNYQKGAYFSPVYYSCLHKNGDNYKMESYTFVIDLSEKLLF